MPHIFGEVISEYTSAKCIETRKRQASVQKGIVNLKCHCFEQLEKHKDTRSHSTMLEIFYSE